MHQVWYLCIPATLPDVQRCRGRQLLLLCFIGCINKSNTLVQGLCLYSTLLQCSMHNCSGLVLTEHGRTRRKFMWHQKNAATVEQSGWKSLCTPPVLANPTRDETCTSHATAMLLLWTSGQSLSKLKGCLFMCAHTQSPPTPALRVSTRHRPCPGLASSQPGSIPQQPVCVVVRHLLALLAR